MIQLESLISVKLSTNVGFDTCEWLCQKCMSKYLIPCCKNILWPGFLMDKPLKCLRCSESFLAVKSKSATMWVQLSLFYICTHCVHSRKRRKWSWNCLYYVFRLPSEDNLTKCLLIQKPRCEFPSVLDMLLIDNPVVTNCLIDQVHILYSFISSHVYDILVFTCCEKINAQSFLFVINCLLKGPSRRIMCKVIITGMQIEKFCQCDNFMLWTQQC